MMGFRFLSCPTWAVIVARLYTSPFQGGKSLGEVTAVLIDSRHLRIRVYQVEGDWIMTALLGRRIGTTCVRLG